MSEFDPDFTEFPLNSYVLFEHPEGPADKFRTRREGPFQVVNHKVDQFSNSFTLLSSELFIRSVFRKVFD